jgi:restriction endonuclease Mrr
MTFPADIKNAMRDCILKLLWPKKDIVNIFENAGMIKHDIQKIGEYNTLNRAQIVDSLFEILSTRPDEGLAQFRALLQLLINWSHFDTYYFDKLNKLNRGDAQRAIEHLKQLQEIRDSKIKAERKKRGDLEKKAQEPSQTLNELNAQYIALLQDENNNSQKRGYDLEKMLTELARLCKLEATEPFRVNGEQIDGAIKYEGEHYILEAKWQEKASSNEPVYQFASKIEGKMYGRGIFISINGYSENVISSLTTGKAIRTIFIDGADLMLVMEGFFSFSDLIDKKVKAAQTKGLIYIDVTTGKSKGETK